MRKGVLFLIFAMVFTMIVPVQVSGLSQKQSPELSIKDDINGKYEISVKTGEEWNAIGTLSFGKYQSTQTIDAGSYLTGDSLTVKLSQAGGGSAYLDAVLLDGSPALKANFAEGKLLNKLSKEDLDIAPVGEEGVVLEFEDAEEGILTVAGRIENEVISKEPLQFPAENNYKSKDEVEDFYSYTVGSNFGTVKVDGVLDEAVYKEPFVKEYRVPDSGHPAGDIYFWVMNDDENLYVAMDTTPDNTFDGDKDYAKVYVKTDEGIKEFKVSVPEITWGKSGFTYTDKTVYEHKVYEFAIPLNEIGSLLGQEINIAFVAYGTMSLNESCDLPSLAYDSQNEVYLSVFEQLYTSDSSSYQRIIGEFVNKYGSPTDSKFVIESNEIINGEALGKLRNPSVAYNSEDNEFIVTWVDSQEDTDYICAKLLSYNDRNSYSFKVFSNDDNYHGIKEQKVSYDSASNTFLIVWAEDNGKGTEGIYGQFLNYNGSKNGPEFIIGTPDNTDKGSPSVAYSESQGAFLVVWQQGDNVEACGVRSPDRMHVSNMVIAAEGRNPHVSYNNSSQRLFVTWENDGTLYGKYFDLNKADGVTHLDPYPVSDSVSISSTHDGYGAAYPSAYYSGFSRDMLCVWNMFKPEQECFAELRYIDIEARLKGSPFFTDEEPGERDNLDDTDLTPIAISGDNESQNLIAYVLDGSNNIGYRIINEADEEPVGVKISVLNPDIAYDGGNDLYLSVYEYQIKSAEGDVALGSYIYGDIVDSNGNVLEEKIPIRLEDGLYCYNPAVAYNKDAKNFLVVWSERINDSESNKLTACTVEIDRNEESWTIGSAFSITDSYEGIVNEDFPDLDYGSGEFLVIWRQYNSNNNKFEIHGRLLDPDNTSDIDTFKISSSTDTYNPSVCYSSEHDTYIAAWEFLNKKGENNLYFSIAAQTVDSSGNLAADNDFIIVDNNLDTTFPDVALNTSNNEFFITWDNGNDVIEIMGQYFTLDESLAPVNSGEQILITHKKYMHGYYPTSYCDGKGNMLSVWDDTEFEEAQLYYARLQYIDKDGILIGDAFYPEEYDSNYPMDNLDPSTFIKASGDYNGRVIIAYNYKLSNQGYYSALKSSEYITGIRYLVFGETSYVEPHIEFDKDVYQIDLSVKSDAEFSVLLYDSAYPNGINITNIDNLQLEIENDSIAAINKETGLITGLDSGTTSVSAVYYPEGDEMDLPEGSLLATATITVTAPEPGEPSLTFVPGTIEKYVGDEFSVKINYFDGLKTIDVTDSVEIDVDDVNVAVTDSAIKGKIICKTAGEATLRTTHAGITATAALKVKERVVSSGSSAPVRTPIGQILVDNKVIETIYEEDVKVKNNTYTFTADKAGKSAKLWLDSGFYKDLAGDYPDRIIKFNWNKGTYTLPLSCDEVLDEIDSSAKKVNILIEKVDDSKIIKAAKDSAENMGAEIVSDLIDFSVIVEKSKGNKEIHSLDFYAERTINQLDNINENISTAMKFVENKGHLTFAPSVFDGDSATIRYRGNGIFTIVENPQTFNDIAGHWAKVNIEKLAARNIAFGKENNNFAPQDFVTRAEFAVMITRALGITEEEGSNDFTDVASEWFAEDVSTAYESGLINGKNDGRFYPNEKIQRKDMAVMIHNALKFGGMNLDVPNADSALSMFNDHSSIDGYARESTAVCVKAGIIMGRDTNNFDPDHNATRAEASAIIERMLKFLEFMN